MIIKSYEINKIDLEKFNLFLFYGENEGSKIETTKNFINKLGDYKEIKYEEKEVLENSESFISKILNKSLFGEKKMIIVNRATDKSINLIQDLIPRNISECKIIFISDLLQKRSKLRMIFETEKGLVCVPFYKDNNNILISLASNFFKKKKIQISNETINLIAERSAGDRINLYNELKKIESFSKNNNKITYQDIIKLTNLAEDYSISEIIDNCLAKNIKKIVTILNENNFTSEDCIIILRTLLYKSKRLLKLVEDFQITNDVDKSVSSYKPVIFWKEKEIVKNQIKKWSAEDIKKLIIETYEMEMLIKKNSTSSLNILYDFILNKSKAA